MGQFAKAHDISFSFIQARKRVTTTKKDIEVNVRCYFLGFRAWNNESIKLLSGPDRQLLNRART